MHYILTDAQTPVDLNGVTYGYSALPKGHEVTIQPFLQADTSRSVLVRVTASAASSATTAANAIQFIDHGGAWTFRTEPAKQVYLHWALITSAGAAATGGSTDKLFVAVED